MKKELEQSKVVIVGDVGGWRIVLEYKCITTVLPHIRKTNVFTNNRTYLFLIDWITKPKQNSSACLPTIYIKQQMQLQFKKNIKIIHPLYVQMLPRFLVVILTYKWLSVTKHKFETWIKWSMWNGVHSCYIKI